MSRTEKRIDAENPIVRRALSGRTKNFIFNYGDGHLEHTDYDEMDSHGERDKYSQTTRTKKDWSEYTEEKYHCWKKG